MKRNVKRFVCLLLVLVMSIIMPTQTVSQAAKKKIPKLNKSTLSLTVGKTAKLKVKNTTKKIKWSSSKKSVATVTQKGKVKAKKAGKATITAKIGKKKLKCKVTVTAKKVTATVTQKPTAKPDSNTGSTATAPITPTVNKLVSIRVLNGSQIEAVFSAEQKLTTENFTIYHKKYKSGNYNEMLKVREVTSMDNKSYLLTLDSTVKVSMDDYVQMTVTGLTQTGTSTMETLYSETVKAESETTVTATVEKNSNAEIELDGHGYKTIVSADLPEGLEYEIEMESDGSTYFCAKGMPTKTGIFNKNIVYKDEWGTTYTEKVQWVIGSNDVLSAACNASYGVHMRGDYTSLTGYFKVVGGSGSYVYKVLNSDATINPSSKYINKDFDNPGTYRINVQVTDENNSELTTTFAWTVYVKEAREITVRVLDGMGNVLSDTYREVTFTNQDTTVPYSQSSYDYFYYGKNDLQLWAVDGVYDIYIDIYGYTYMKSSYKVNGKDTQLDIQLPVYRVEAKASNLGYSISEMDWYNEDEQMCASGNIMYLPVGVHKLHGARAQAIRRFDMEINCTVKACAVNNVIATVKEEEKIYGTIEVDNPLKIKVGAAMECYAFTPTETATYKFYTYNSSYTYTLGKLYNSSLYSIASSSTYNNGHFTFSKQCEAGKTYYIGVYASSDYVGRQVELRVEKEE